MEKISCVMELKKDDFHYNIYDELKELYKNRVYNYPQYRDRLEEIEDFINQYLELVKDDSNEKFKKYNCGDRDYQYNVRCRLYTVKKDFLEIEKNTCVFIPNPNLDHFLMFYLKEDSKNVELAKEVWMNELNYGNFNGKKDFINLARDDRMYWNWDSFNIKDKDKYITKIFRSYSYIQIVAQTKFILKEIV